MLTLTSHRSATNAKQPRHAAAARGADGGGARNPGGGRRHPVPGPPADRDPRPAPCAGGPAGRPARGPPSFRAPDLGARHRGQDRRHDPGAVGDGSTFPTSDRLASYAGLAPVTKSSGSSIRGDPEQSALYVRNNCHPRRVQLALINAPGGGGRSAWVGPGKPTRNCRTSPLACFSWLTSTYARPPATASKTWPWSRV